jgi:hypothetical protein
MASNIFLPGAVKTAAITLTLDSSLVGLALTAELFLSKDGGVTKTVTGGTKSFTAALTQSFNYTITMPNGTTQQPAGTYKAYFDVYYQGAMLIGFMDVNDIVIPGGSVTPIVWT